MTDLACLTARLGDHIELSTTTTDIPVLAAGGSVLRLHSIRGWDDSADDATNLYPHTSGDGQSSGLLRSGARQILLQGLVKSKHGFGFGSVSDVSTLMKRTRRSTLYISEIDGLAREADVRVDWQATRLSDPILAAFTLSLVADDPLLYNQGHIDLPNGSTGLPNCGDRNAYPQIELTGPIASLTIKHPGGTFSFAVPSGAHRIDCRNGTIWGPNGRQVHGSHSGAWPVVPAGGAEWVIGGSMSSAGTIKVRRWEAWS